MLFSMRSALYELLTLTLAIHICAQTTAAPGNPCAIAGDLIDICTSITPGFTDLELATQASCLCYGWINSAAYEPSVYDDAFGACASYLSTEDPEDYSTIVAGYGTITAPCMAIGNVAEATTTDTYGITDFINYLSASASPTTGPGFTAPQPTSRYSGAAASQATGSNGGAFPTPGSTPGGVAILTPGSAAGTLVSTGIGGTALHSTRSSIARGSSAVIPGVGEQTGVAAHIKANAGALIGAIAVVAAL